MVTVRTVGWSLSRADLAAGAGELLRLVHPLLPDFTSALPDADGLRLGPGVPVPGRLRPGRTPASRRSFLVRLLGLAAFLKSRGLGLAPGDLDALGSQRDDEARPALGAPPVPEWRAVSPALVAGAAALRLEGIRLGAATAAGLRQELGEALEEPPDAFTAAVVVAALRADEASRAPEALLLELARGGELEKGIGSDLLGLVLPSAFLAERPPGESLPAAGSGPAALFVVRGAVRKLRGERAFVEVPSGSPLREGSALRRAAEALGSDPRAKLLRDLSRGAATPKNVVGPPLALVARDAELWDPRSRRVFERELGAGQNLLRFETLGRAAAPWEEREPLRPRLGPAEVSGLVWLPFASLGEAVASWEAVARRTDGDAARFLAAARELAAAFNPARALGTAPMPFLRAARGRREPAVEAAAILCPGFGEDEVAAAAGVSRRDAVDALRRGVESGRLEEEPARRFRFRDEAARRAAAGRLPAAARRDAVARLEAVPLAPGRLVAAALARGTAADISAAREALREARDTGDRAAALALLRRAPASDPALGLALFAIVTLAGAGESETARHLGRHLDAAASLASPPEERLAAARALARLGEAGRALALTPGGGEPAEALARARLLLDAHQEDEAGTILDALAPDGAPAERLNAALLRAELAERRRDFAAAAAQLRRVARILRETKGPAPPGAAATAGYLAGDMGRQEEALFFFRRAREEAQGDAARADASVDLAVTAIHLGRFAEAERELENALALYAACRDRERYLSALGNRADLHLLSGRYAAARADLDRVLANDRAPGRERQLLFSIPSRQKLALLDGDDATAEEAFEEAVRLPPFRGHPAEREAIILEAARLLARSLPEEALARLEEAALIPDNRMRNEPLLARLRASARLDLGRAVDPGTLDPEERPLVEAEARLARGQTLPGGVARDLVRRLETGPGAGEAVLRLLEWLGRFPRAFDGKAGEELAALGRRAAARAGLPGASARFAPLARGRARPLPEPAPTATPDGGPVAVDGATRAVFDVVARMARTALPILILGESGTGKEIVARELHRLSGRRGRFVAVNVAALSSTLVESELFGHARGAFTGADRERTGLVEASSGGTLFLDEIGDLPLALQAKLLRVLQERELTRVGEVASRRVDLRVVAATHRDLEAMRRDLTFRSDLYHRLNGATVVLPPLRERPLDLAALVERTLDGSASLSPPARRLVLAYRWPGNVRELLAALETARAMAAPSLRIEPEHLPASLRPVTPGAAQDPRPEGSRYRIAVDEARRRAIRESLEEAGGNRTHAAKLLGLSRQSLLYEMKKLRIG